MQIPNFEPGEQLVLPGDVVDFGDLPAILANPALLQAGENAANIVGDTYQSFINKFTTAVEQCTGNCASCYDSVVQKMVDQYQNISNDYLAALSQLSLGICHPAATAISGANNAISQAIKTIADAIAAIPVGSVAIVFNCLPNQANWNYPDIPYGVWFDPAFESYTIDSSGKIIRGSRLNSDNSYTFTSGITVPFNTDGLQTLQSYLSSGDIPGNADYNENTPIAATYQCGDLPIDESGNIETPPVIPAPVYSVPPAVPNPIDGSTVVTSPVVAAPGTPIQNVSNTTNENVTNIQQGANCPAPIVTVNVPAPIVNVNVAPCQPSNTTIVNQIASTTNNANQTPVCDDAYIAMLLFSGYTQDEADAFCGYFQQYPDAFVDIDEETSSVGLFEDYD